MGGWDPSPTLLRLLGADTADTDASRPDPFFLAHALEGEPDELGDPAEWQVEWKWDDIRAQVVRRAGKVFVWSRGEELVTERFPELAAAASLLPDGTVLDGELLPWREGGALPFAQLQRRIGRTALGPKILSEVPVVLLAYDLLEMEGMDVREQPMAWRRERLAELLGAVHSGGRLLLSPLVPSATWDEVRQAYRDARQSSREGLMLNRAAAPTAWAQARRWWNGSGDLHRGLRLIYAQRGTGVGVALHRLHLRRLERPASWCPSPGYSGRTDEEIRRVDSFVRRNTLQRFGPVRAVKPGWFRTGVRGNQRSPRHKSGSRALPAHAPSRTDRSRGRGFAGDDPGDAGTGWRLLGLSNATASHAEPRGRRGRAAALPRLAPLRETRTKPRDRSGGGSGFFLRSGRRGDHLPAELLL